MSYTDLKGDKVNNFYKINHQIRADQVRVIDDQGKQIEIMSLPQALSLAQEKGLDLIEIAPDAKPPVVKVIDFKKFKYLEEKKKKEARKHTKETELKEVRFSPFIGDHDLEVGLNKIKKFISDGDLVKISIVFRGRQMIHQEFGPRLLARIILNLEGLAQQEREARFEGKRFVTILKQTKALGKQENKPEPTAQNNTKTNSKNNETQNKESSSQKI